MTKNSRKCIGWNKDILKLSQILHRSYIKKRVNLRSGAMIFQKIYRDQESWSCVVKLIPVVDHFLFNLKPSENPINPCLKKKRMYFNLHFIAVVSQPCMLQKNLSFNSPLYSIVVSLQNRRNSWALSSEQKRARGERGARVLRFATDSRDALACKTQK